jgi:hypothetical protein
MSVRPRRTALLVRAGSILILIAALASCSRSKPVGTVTTVTVPPSSSATHTSTSASASTSPSRTAAPKTRSSSPTLVHLPGPCDTLLPLAAVDNALNRSLKGKTAFIVGTPEKDIKRLAYINCRYGVTSAKGTPPVEIGVSLYQSAAAAQARIQATVDDYVNNGAHDSTTRVAGHAAHLLTGGRGPGLTAPTLVLADGQRTVAVSVAKPIPPAAQRKALVALATLADKATR